MTRVTIEPSDLAYMPIDFCCGGELYVIHDKLIYGTSKAIQLLVRSGLKYDVAKKYVENMRTK